MTYPELKNIFQELKRTSPREDLTAHIVFTEDSFSMPYPLLSRTYLVSSDNKGWRTGTASGSSSPMERIRTGPAAISARPT